MRRCCLLICLILAVLSLKAQDDMVLRDEPNPTKDNRSPKPRIPRKRAARYTQAQHRQRTDPKVRMRYRLSGAVGWLNRDDKIAGTSKMHGLTLDRPVVLGGTVAVEFLPTGRLESLQQWNNASIGLAFSAFDLGQQHYLGQAFAPYAYLNVPLVKTRRFVFGLRPGIGVGFVTRTYANTVPDDLRWEAYQVTLKGETKSRQIANISVGSIANAFLSGGLYMDFPLRKGWDLTFSLAWQHLSNGSVMTPNAGYNMFNAEVGFAYTPSNSPRGFHFHEPYTKVPHSLYDGVEKKWDVEISAGGGARSVYYRDRDWFGVAALSLSAHWKPLSIFRLGGGVDVFYDGAYAAVCDEFAKENTAHVTYFSKTYLAESKLSNCFRVGVSLQPEMVLGNLTFGYHLGIYLYDPVKNLEPYAEAEKGLKRGIFYSYDPLKASTYQDGWFYQTLLLKYRCSRHIFVQLGLKVHIMKAEFLYAGLGLAF